MNGRRWMNDSGTLRPTFRWAEFALLSLLAMLSGMALSDADWADHLNPVPWIVLLAVFSGAALARTIFRARTAAIFSAVYGLPLIGWLYGQTLDPALYWHERIGNMIGRMGSMASSVAAGQPNQDALPVVMLLALFYWAMGTSAAWFLFRKGEIGKAVVPLGVALLVNAYYYIGPARLEWLFGLYVTVALILAVIHELIQGERAWRLRGARVQPNPAFQAVRPALLAVLFIAALAWVGPAFASSETASSAWSRISQPWRVTRDRLADVVAGFRSPVLLVSDEYGSTLALGAGIVPVDQVVMQVRPLGRLSGEGRFYWRAKTYSRFEGGSWSTTGTELRRFNPRDSELEGPTFLGREEIELIFTPVEAIFSNLYMPAQPVWVNRTAEVAYILDGDEVVDVSAVYARQRVFGGEAYRVRSAVAVPTADQLRAAGAAYPDWVEAEYLQVPESITPRTRELAQLIAGDLASPYDKAAAMTAWLRRTIEYQDTIAAPPADREPLDWFLFSYQKGFCNYYATAEVIMLRTLGVPARLGVGYARGNFRSESGIYEVHARDYHAWPEVYFPGYGWVEFEPTVSQPALNRPDLRAAGAPDGGPRAGFDVAGEGGGSTLGPLDIPLIEDDPAATSAAGGGIAGVTWVRLGLIGLGLAGVAAALIWRMDPAWRLALFASSSRPEADPARSEGMWARLASALSSGSPAEEVYRSWMSWWARLGLKPTLTQTPDERAALFSRAYPDAGPAARQIAEAYGSERFGGGPAETPRLKAAWGQLRPMLWKSWLKKYLDAFLRLVQKE